MAPVRRAALTALGLLCAAAALWAAWRLLGPLVPPRLDPRAPPDLAAPPDALTRWRLARLEADPPACFGALAAAGLPVERVRDQPIRNGCGIEGGVRLPSRVPLRPNAPVATCGVAAAWAIWERHTLQPAARRHLGSDLAWVRHAGTYNCRDVRGSGAGEGRGRSQHATANAVDVTAFGLRDGREVTLRAWRTRDGGPEAAFLREARDGACRVFGAVLGPEWDAAHAGHFHLDRGRARVCR